MSKNTFRSENRNLDLTNFCAGDYTLEVFFELIGSHNSTTKCNESLHFYKDENGKSFKMNFTIHEEVYLTAYTPQKTINEGEDVSLFCESKNQADIVKYVWKHSKFNSKEQNPIIKKIKPNQSGIYTVWVNTKCDKWYKKELEIQVIPKPKTVITPSKNTKQNQPIAAKTTETNPKEEVVRTIETSITELKAEQNTIQEKPMVIVPKKEKMTLPKSFFFFLQPFFILYIIYNIIYYYINNNNNNNLI